MANHILILAAGQGSRLSSNIPKQFLEINGMPILFHSLKIFSRSVPNVRIHVALPQNYIKTWRTFCIKYNFNTPHDSYVGGDSRIHTVFKGLNKIATEDRINNKTIVGIHDAARPFLNSELITKLINTAISYGSAIPFIHLKSALSKRNTKKNNSYSLNRNDYVLTQTPQFFHFDQIFESYCKVFSKFKIKDLSNLFFDDASVYEYFKIHEDLQMLEGDESNLKITTDLDYFIAEKLYEFSVKK